MRASKVSRKTAANVVLIFTVGALLLGGLYASRAQQTQVEDVAPPVLDADCPYFGPLRGKTDQPPSSLAGPKSLKYSLSRLTQDVVKQLPDLPAEAAIGGDNISADGAPFVPGGSRSWRISDEEPSVAESAPMVVPSPGWKT